MLGLIAEKATETMRRDPADFVSAGVTIDAAPYLGPVTADAHGLIQRIEVRQLLPASVRDLLFNESAARLMDARRIRKPAEADHGAGRRLDRLFGRRARGAGAAVGLPT